MEILIGGDVFLGGKWELISSEQPEKIWSGIIELLNSVDFRVINLESPLTDSKHSILKTGPNIKSKPTSVNALKAAKIDLVTLANNHILDFGEKGIKDTLEVCLENGIHTVGAGLNLNDAKDTFFKIIEGKRIAFINFAENEWSSACENSAGSNPLNLIDNYQAIKNAKMNSDYVITIIHGGHEYYNLPSPRMVKYYRFFADAGSDAVIGHHTHCVSGREIYNGVPIIYSLGNLLFNGSSGKNEHWYQGVLAKISINNELNIELIPFYQSKGEIGIELMQGEDKNFFLQEIDFLSDIISDNEKLISYYDKFISKSYKNHLFLLNGEKSLFYRVLKKIGLYDLVLKPKYLVLLLNLIRCEAHKDLSQEVLDKYYKMIK